MTSGNIMVNKTMIYAAGVSTWGTITASGNLHVGPATGTCITEPG